MADGSFIFLSRLHAQVGLELTTLRSRVMRSTDCASQAPLMAILKNSKPDKPNLTKFNIWIVFLKFSL